jgi:glycosyltransferase involved in cell wall biosynthesis
MKRPGLLFVMNDLRPGGAEMFVIRLAQFMQQKFDIYIYSCFPENDNVDFIGQFKAAVPFTSIPHPNETLPAWRETTYWKLNAIATLLGYQGLYVKLRAKDRKRHFDRELKVRNIRVINSSSSHSDGFAVNFLKQAFKIPVVISVHSAYNRENWGPEDKQESFFAKAAGILLGADALLYTADHNMEIMQKIPSLKKVRVEKVYLGYVPKTVTVTRSDLGWPADAMVITMMARGIPEKGWQHAIEAFTLLQKHYANCLLILISTETEHIRLLREQHASNLQIHFVGYVADPSDILQNSNCTILPSHYPESLPYAITESLAYGTPVFATPVAEIPKMLQTDEGIAGGIIPLTPFGVADSAYLSQQLYEMAKDGAHREEMRRLAHLAFQKFSMSHCGGRYLEIFTELMDGSH